LRWYIWVGFDWEMVDEVACCRCGCLRGRDRQRERSTAATADLRADPATARRSYPAAAWWTDGLGAGTLALGRLPVRVETRPLCPAPAGIRALRGRSLDLGATRRTVDLAPRALGMTCGGLGSRIHFGSLKFRPVVPMLVIQIRRVMPSVLNH
jgi:hypothetical protein